MYMCICASEVHLEEKKSQFQHETLRFLSVLSLSLTFSLSFSLSLTFFRGRRCYGLRIFVNKLGSLYDFTLSTSRDDRLSVTEEMALPTTVAVNPIRAARLCPGLFCWCWCSSFTFFFFFFFFFCSFLEVGGIGGFPPPLRPRTRSWARSFSSSFSGWAMVALFFCVVVVFFVVVTASSFLPPLRGNNGRFSLFSSLFFNPTRLPLETIANCSSSESDHDELISSSSSSSSDEKLSKYSLVSANSPSTRLRGGAISS